jgi:hypothetical protein
MAPHRFAQHQRDETIFTEESESDEFVIVIKGYVGFSKTVNGKQELLHQVGPGGSAKMRRSWGPAPIFSTHRRMSPRSPS